MQNKEHLHHISLYQGVKDNTGSLVDIREQLTRIADENKLRIAIEALRTIQDKKRRATAKQKLEAVTWSGSFAPTRSAENIQWHSGIICIDVDDLQPEQISEYISCFETDQYIWTWFISPSGNGLKLLFQTALMGEVKGKKEAKVKIEQHARYFRAIANYLKHTYGILADESGKDVSRLCFLTHYPKIEVRLHAETVTADILQIPPFRFDDKPKPIAKPQTQQPTTQHGEIDLLQDARQFTDRIYTYDSSDSGNKYINTFCFNCKKSGVNKEEVEYYCLNNFADYEADKPGEIKKIVNSVYNNSSIPFGSKRPFQKQNKQQKQHSAPAPTDDDINDEEADRLAVEGFNTETLFWYPLEKVNKDTGEVIEEVKFSYEDGITFLENNGFCKLLMDNGNYQFIRIKNNVVEAVNILKMRTFMLALLKTKPVAYKKAREMFRRGSKQYSAASYLEGLRDVRPQFNRDTKDTAFIYFRNCYVEVTAEGLKPKQYSELKGCIWSTQKIDADFTLDNSEAASIYQEFIQCSILGRRLNDNDTVSDKEAKMLASTYTAAGYMMHGYKDPVNVKCVILVDKSLRNYNESNGRSGKTLYCKALGYVVPRCTIDGRNFKWDGRNPFDKLNLDHRILHFDDTPKNFDFERTYSLTTEDFTYTKMYQDSITIPFEDSPKIMITTNTTLRATGESAKARQHIIEFSNFFNAENTPFKVFGHRFFSDWESNEWNLYYNFKLQCIQLFLKKGLIPFPLETYDENKLIDDIGFDEVEWIESRILAAWSSKQRQEKKAMFNDFVAEFQNKRNMKQNTFSKWLEQICLLRNYRINEHINGKRDKSGSIEYLTFTRPQADKPKPEEEAF